MREETCKVIDVSKIKPSNYNLRKYDEEEPVDSSAFIELAESIKANGLIEPIVVRKGKGDEYEAVAGSRRLRALKHIGIKTTATVVKQMTDNDVRIASLVENIKRKGLDNETKQLGLREIYTAAGFKDINEVTKYLSAIRNRQYKERAKFKLKKVKHHETNDGQFKVNIPAIFMEIFKRVGYSASIQYNMLMGYGDYEDDRDWSAELQPTVREEFDKYSDILKDKEVISQETARKASKKKSPRLAKQVIRQAVHDIKTGAITEDEEGVSYHPHKREDLYSSKLTEENPVQAREKIIELSEKLYKLLTGIEQDNNLNRAETQATSDQSMHHMKEVCSYNLGLRELPALEGAIAPLQKALDKFVDIMYDVGEAERRKNELRKR